MCRFVVSLVVLLVLVALLPSPLGMHYAPGLRDSGHLSGSVANLRPGICSKLHNEMHGIRAKSRDVAFGTAAGSGRWV